MTAVAIETTVAIEIEDPAWQACGFDLTALIDPMVRAALQHMITSDRSQNGILQNLVKNKTCNGEKPEAWDVTVLLTDDAEMAEIHDRFLGQKKPTNILSFPAAASAYPHLGDMVLSFQTCQTEANRQNKAFSDHISHLIVHGILHLLGFDHQSEDEALAMEAEEIAILARFGISNPYVLKESMISQSSKTCELGTCDDGRG